MGLGGWAFWKARKGLSTASEGQRAHWPGRIHYAGIIAGSVAFAPSCPEGWFLGPVAMRGLSFGLARSKQLEFGKSNPNEDATAETREKGFRINEMGPPQRGKGAYGRRCDPR